MNNNWQIEAFTANDNDPAQKTARGDAVGFRALLKENQQSYLNHIDKQQDGPSGHESKLISYCSGAIYVLWLVSVALFAWSYLTGQPIGARLVSSTALIITGLFHAHLEQLHHQNKSSELSIFLSLIGFMALLMTAVTQLGLPMPPNAGICLFAVAALMIAYLNGSPIALSASVAAGFVWAALFLDGFLPASIWMMLIPALVSLQALLAKRFNAPMILLTSIVMAYGWIAGSGAKAFAAGQLSPEFLLSGVFLLGLMHQQICQSSNADDMPGKNLQFLFGWALMCAALIGLIMWGFSHDSDLWQNPALTAPITRLIWLGACALALGITLMAMLYRRKFQGLSYTAIGWQLCAAALVPALAWFEPAITAYGASAQALPLYPALSYVLGGAVFALACFFAVRGLQDGYYIFAAAGIGVIAIVSELCLKGISISPDNLALFALGFLALSAVKTMTAQRNSMTIATNRRLNKSKQRIDRAA